MTLYRELKLHVGNVIALHLSNFAIKINCTLIAVTKHCVTVDEYDEHLEYKGRSTIRLGRIDAFDSDYNDINELRAEVKTRQLAIKRR